MGALFHKVDIANRLYLHDSQSHVRGHFSGTQISWCAFELKTLRGWCLRRREADVHRIAVSLDEILSGSVQNGQSVGKLLHTEAMLGLGWHAHAQQDDRDVVGPSALQRQLDKLGTGLGKRVGASNFP